MNRQTGDTIFTIGHSTRTLAEFVALLRQVDVTRLVDVRSLPWSRMTPQFNTDTLPGALAAEGIGYRHLGALGGRRHHRQGAPPSLNMYWRVAAFRNYADYAETDEFRAGLQALRELARDDRCAIMCTEAVWWRCHRRIIRLPVGRRHARRAHLGPGQVVPATLTPGARVPRRRDASLSRAGRRRGDHERRLSKCRHSSHSPRRGLRIGTRPSWPA